MRQHISHYGATNTHEMLAEAFADVMAHGSKASGLSRALVDGLDQDAGRHV